MVNRKLDLHCQLRALCSCERKTVPLQLILNIEMYGFKNREVIPLLAPHCIIPLVLCVIILHQSSQDYTDERVQPQLDYPDPVIFLLSSPELSLIYQTILYL